MAMELKPLPPMIHRGTLLQLYEEMWLIRYFDEKVDEFFARGLIHGTTHLCVGQEATSAGAIAVLRPEDKITSTHRGHGHCISKGADVNRMMAELFARETGYCKGKGGSMHIADVEKGNLGANGIVGGGIPIAVGSALTSKMKGLGYVTFCFFGDGAANEGSFHESLNLASDWGIETGELTIHYDRMIARKDKVILQLRGGISQLMKHGGVDVIRGFGSVLPDRSVLVRTAEGERLLASKAVILATGSTPVVPPIPGAEDSGVHTSDTIFGLRDIPERLLIVGGGYIGVEFACMYSGLGSKVTVVEAASGILPSEDYDTAETLRKSLIKNGVKLLVASRVTSFRREGCILRTTVEGADGETLTIETEEAVVAVGRRPNISAISELNLQMNGHFVEVNDRMECSIPGFYAIGDLAGGWQLAHAASAEGLVAAANACGRLEKLDPRAMPRCIYTQPEIASVGFSVEEARERGYKVRVTVQRLAGTGKGMAMDARIGFIKLIADEVHGEILGVIMVGPHVTEMIAEAAAFIQLEGTVEELASLIHPHPTLSEGLMEAAQAWRG
jgi:dihydrolipoamide dehydrogenase